MEFRTLHESQHLMAFRSLPSLPWCRHAGLLPPPRALFFFVRVSSTGRLDLLSLSFLHTEAGKLAVHEHSQYHRPLTSSNGKRWLE